eukprot:3617569-Rhodomonas_salina.1
MHVGRSRRRDHGRAVAHGGLPVVAGDHDAQQKQRVPRRVQVIVPARHARVSVSQSSMGVPLTALGASQCQCPTSCV